MNEKEFAEKNRLIKDNSTTKDNFIYKIRSYFYKKCQIWDIFDFFPYGVRMCYYDHIRPIFKPYHTRLRKVIPRQWADLLSIIDDVNFEIIKSFYEDEYLKDTVNWEATPHHKQFADWLIKAYKYITEIRPQLEIDMNNAYPPLRTIDEMFKPVTDENGKKLYQMIDDGVPYEIKYGEVNRIEKLIEDNDTDVLVQMIKFRKFFWT
jgi:hypothetical protein